MMDDLVKFNHLGQYKEISHCFTTKKDGVSNGVFTSLNMGFNRGDKPENVLQNYTLVCQALGIDVNNLVLSNQVHKDLIRTITKDDIGKGIFRKSDILEVDGLMTDIKGIGLVTFYADCVPLFFYDPIHKAIATSHAGWRGTVLKIGAKTIKEMQKNFNTNPEDVLVGIGPSIGGCCYEVSADVKKEFDLSFNDDIIAKVVKPLGDKYFIDLWEANKQSLIECGVNPLNIETSELCTKCHEQRFFSHRVMGINRGSQVAIMALI